MKFVDLYSIPSWSCLLYQQFMQYKIYCIIYNNTILSTSSDHSSSCQGIHTNHEIRLVIGLDLLVGAILIYNFHGQWIISCSQQWKLRRFGSKYETIFKLKVKFRKGDLMNKLQKISQSTLTDSKYNHENWIHFTQK